MRAVLLTGGNLGNREENLCRARRLIAERAGRIEALSSVVETGAWGFSAPERFLNQAVVIDTPLEAEDLLERTQQIERELGREREKSGGAGQLSGGNPVSRKRERYASRTMDIDILFYGERIEESPRLTLPHPRLQEREFALAPLCQVMPEYRHPKLGRTMRELREELHRRLPEEPYAEVYSGRNDKNDMK